MVRVLVQPLQDLIPRLAGPGPFADGGAPMHIPDGFLSPAVAVGIWIVAAVFIAIALRQSNRLLNERSLPLMGVLGAAIFAGQMLNFAVAGGTSGHLLGAALAAVLLGPWPAVIVMTTVVVVQAILFQDGGLLALGANIVNMGVIGVFVGWGVYRTIRGVIRGERAQLLVGGAVAAWASVVIASLAAALELALSGTSPANVAIPAMASVHVLIGIGEGLITAGALSLVLATRPDLAREGAKRPSPWVWVGGLVIATVLAVLSPLASSSPDGLERVAENLGFAGMARSSSWGLIPDYLFPGVRNEAVGTVLAGLVGLVVVFVVAFGVSAILRRRTATAAPRSGTGQSL